MCIRGSYTAPTTGFWLFRVFRVFRGYDLAFVIRVHSWPFVVQNVLVPFSKGGRGGDCASVVTCKAFLVICRNSCVVMGLRGYVGEDIDIEEGHWE